MINNYEKGIAVIKLRIMILEKDEMTEKLRTCKEISEVVSRLPNITSQAECDKITKQIVKELVEHL